MPAPATAGRRGAIPDRGAALSADARRIVIAAAAAFREADAASRADAAGDVALASDYWQRLVHIAHVVGDPADVRALAAAFATAAAVPPSDADLADAARALAAVAAFVEGIRDPDRLASEFRAALLAAAPRAAPPFNTLDNLFVGI